MKVINLGPDELDEYSIEGLNRNRPLDISIKRLYYWYSNGGYEGSGNAVYQDNKGNWHIDNLGHCSCNGPFEDGFNAIPYTRKQVIHLLKKDLLYSEEDKALINALNKLRS